MREISAIVVHCADTPDALDIGRKEIDSWHKAKGWNGVGYHYVIRRDGTIEVGRFETVVGAHVEGHNAKSIGVCWVGSVKPGKAQYVALVGMLRDLMDRYKLGVSCVFGHRELNDGKTCPNLDMAALRKELS